MKLLRVFAIALTTAAAMAIVLPTAAAPSKQTKKAPKLYKWTDKDGVVHYGNAVPAEYADQQKEQINEQGQTIKTIDGALTPEQRAAREKSEADAVAAKEQLDNDKVLLSTYGSVSDIERARDARLAAIEGQINIASSTVSAIESQMVSLERQRAAAKDPKQIERLDSTMATHRLNLNSNQRAVMSKQDEKASVLEQFGHDIERFNVMTAPRTETKP